MLSHPRLSLLAVNPKGPSAAKALCGYLTDLPHVHLDVRPALPEELDSYQAVVTVGALTDRQLRTLSRFVYHGGGWLAFVDPTFDPLPAILGASLRPPGPRAELRVLFERRDNPLGVRLPDAIYVKTRHQALVPVDKGTQTILYADWHYDHSPVLTLRHVRGGQVACTTLASFDHRVFQRLCYRLLRQLAGLAPDPDPLGVGILGYAPSVGRLHGLGIAETPGLRLQAVCDLNRTRCDQAREDFPGVAVLPSGERLAETAGVDVVIVATPPNIHADNCLQMMAAGRHVVCEKPLALSRREADALQAAAEKNRVHLGCHQNRRWDPDYLTIRRCLDEGLIGDLFYLETFVGGFAHPCGYWHSHAAISGGTSYDWGAHYLDWIVSLIPQPVKAVVGTRHKRVWQDVTNADQERIQIRFDSGAEAEFMHSDIAAARKPKWYLLGTRGAIIGDWRDVTTHTIDPVHYYHRHAIPATETPPEIILYQRCANGALNRVRPAVAERTLFAFHRNLADHLLLGEPIEAPLQDAVKVVEILEAAARSMERDGTVEVLHGC